MASAGTSGAPKTSVDEFKERIKKEGEHLVHNVFPGLVVELDEMLRSANFQLDRVDQVKDHFKYSLPPSPTDEAPVRPGKRTRVVANGDLDGLSSDKLQTSVPCNEMVNEMIQTVKPIIRRAIDHGNTCKMWIQFMIPKIEDGNNFGVSIQEETLAQVAQAEADSATYLDQITRYYTTRGKLASKLVKYPNVEDYHQSIMELDQRQFISMRLVIFELRNNYSALHDLIIKNIERILKPRNSHIESLY